jgi:hypothetical protein
MQGCLETALLLQDDNNIVNDFHKNETEKPKCNNSRPTFYLILETQLTILGNGRFFNCASERNDGTIYSRPTSGLLCLIMRFAIGRAAGVTAS